MDLYLVRHAVAHKRDYERWPDDADRPLTPEGEENFRGMARNLGRIVTGIEVLLSSPYARAWRTAEILGEETSWPSPREFPALEPEVPPQKVAAVLQSYSGAETLALVGHRPSLHELAAYLLVGDENTLNVGLKKRWRRLHPLQRRDRAGCGQVALVAHAASLERCAGRVAQPSLSGIRARRSASGYSECRSRSVRSTWFTVTFPTGHLRNPARPEINSPGAGAPPGAWK